MKYSCTVISVSDIARSRAFYEELFGLQVCQDYGINVAFSCGIALQQEFGWLVGISQDRVQNRSHNMELCFEEEDFDNFLKKLRSHQEIQWLGDVVEHSWGQRVVRFYDPDGHLIEVGECMKMVIRRFQDAGLSMEEISKRMDVSLKDLESLLEE